MTSYDDIDAMNQSTLKHGLDSMKHLKAAIDGEHEKETPSLRLGSALHCRLLQPGLFASMYRPWPEGNRNTKVWKAAMAEAEAAEPASVFISPVEYGKAFAMGQAVYAHPAVKMLRAHGGTERVLEADLCGVPCKGRADKLIKSPAVILDIKTTCSASVYDFEKFIARWHYDFQAAFYVDLAEAACGQKFDYIFIVIESSSPFDVRVFNLDTASIEVGRQEYRGLLQRYTKCKETGVWPGRSDQIEAIGLPAWKLRRFEQFAM